LLVHAAVPYLAHVRVVHVAVPSFAQLQTLQPSSYPFGQRLQLIKEECDDDVPDKGGSGDGGADAGTTAGVTGGDGRGHVGLVGVGGGGGRTLAFWQVAGPYSKQYRCVQWDVMVPRQPQELQPS
jgi:hypothetical protein